MKMVKLKNGKEELQHLVYVNVAVLEALFNNMDTDLHSALLLYDLVTYCQDKRQPQFGDDLVQIGLMHKNGDKYQMHESIYNITSSTLSMEGDRIFFTYPAA